jgi:hypothetical protein
LRTTILAALAAAAVLIASACGTAGAVGTAATTLGGGASLAPSDAVAFVAVDSNLSSGQWNAVNGLLGKFPSGDKLLASLRQQFAQKTKLSIDDLQAALGDELDLAVLPGAEKRYVGLTQARDQAKLDALLKKIGAHSVQVGGWTAFAETQAALDAFTGATTKLADESFYRTATAKLAPDALVHAYANGIEAQKLMHALATPKDPEQTVPFEWASADVTASGDGLRVHAYARDGVVAGRPTPTQPYTSRLVDEIPADALAVADFTVKPGQFQYGLPRQLQQMLGSTAADLAQLDQVFGGETALYVRQGMPIPEITLVTQPNDTQQATAALDAVLKTLKAQAKGPLAMFNLYHEVIGGQLVASTSQKGLADFRSAGSKLSGASAFKDAQKAAGMPAATTGFVYANLADAIPLVQAFGPLLGLKLPQPLQGDLSALRTLTAFGTRTGAEQSLTVYLQVQ